MKKFVLLLGVLALASCGVDTVTGGNNISFSGDKVVLEGTQDLTIASDAYVGVTALVEVGVRHHAFSQEQLVQIKNLNNQALALLQGADKSLSVAQRSAGVLSIVAQLHSILEN